MGLKEKVIAKINSLGVKDAAKFYGVSVGTVSNWASGKTSPSIEAVELTVSDEPETSKAIEPPELTMWEGRKVAVLMPVYRSLNPDTHFTLFANYVAYGPAKIAIPKPIKQTCVWEARNMLANKAMNMPGIERVIMPDDDMILPHGHASSMNAPQNMGGYEANLPDDLAGINAFSQLLSHSSDKGIIGSLYFGRHERGRAQCNSGFASDVKNEALRNLEYRGLQPEEWVGTGLIKIENWVFKAMKDAIDGGKWPECKPNEGWGPNGYYGFFNPLSVGVGEDVSFCRRAKELGIQSYLDTSIVCLHNGERNYGPKNTKA